MEYCPTASVQPPWQNRFDGLLEYDTLELAGRAPALLPSSADRVENASLFTYLTPTFLTSMFAVRPTDRARLQEGGREGPFRARHPEGTTGNGLPNHEMADSPDSKQSPKQQDRDRGDLVISRFDSLCRK
ncbi:hypothetical protein H4Q26_002590 [Puccinia striiformis f. sp. tritici PST-130]|nr:hypothetical protein H4Q26_002590 [Puccinia striiformis f. sp. tritici PST-130]